MNSVFDLIRNLRIALGCIGELLGYLLRFVSMFLRSRTSLATRLSAWHVQAEYRSSSVTSRRLSAPGGRDVPPSRLLERSSWGDSYTSGLEATRENRKKAEKYMKLITAEIDNGVFQYERHPLKALG